MEVFFCREIKWQPEECNVSQKGLARSRDPVSAQRAGQNGGIMKAGYHRIARLGYSVYLYENDVRIMILLFDVAQ